jgi:hypothetical protein
VFARWGLPVLAAVMAACVLVAGAGAVTKPSVTPRVDITTATGLAKYLGSLKNVNLKRLVVQTGKHNYAGPSCPGVGWTCTTATHVLQYGLNNSFQCSPSNASGGTATPPDLCVIVQLSTTANNNATCTERDSSATADQACAIFQTSTTGTNTATVNQTVSVNGGSTQDATQYAGIDQESSDGANNAWVTQTISASTATPGAGGTEMQDGHQGSSVTQFASGAGNNAANVTQSLSLNATTSGVTAINQLQNTDQTQGPNTNSGIDQTSGTGTNSATLNQTNTYNQAGSGAKTGAQTQGSPVSGENGDFNQSSTGVSTINGTQVERQAQSVSPSAGSSVVQTQYGPLHFEPDQFSNTGNTYNLNQSSTQNQNKSGGFQDDQEFAQCSSSGECTANEGVTQNGHSTSNSCGPISFCNIGVQQTTTPSGTTSSTCSGEGCDTDFPSPPPPPCSYFCPDLLPSVVHATRLG